MMLWEKFITFPRIAIHGPSILYLVWKEMKNLLTSPLRSPGQVLESSHLMT